MKRKSLLMLPCIAAVAIATFVGTKAIKSDADESNNLLMANVEALSNPSDTGSSFLYPDRASRAKFCTIYVYSTISGSIVATSESPISKYEVGSRYIREVKEGISYTCPKRGTGCTPYSCRVVSYKDF